RSQEPCTQQLMRVFDFQGRSIIGLEKVPHDKVERYGIIAGKPINGRLYLLEDMIEKPSPAKAPSDLAIGGRYILTPRIFECIEKTQPGKHGEIQLTDAIRLMKNKEPVYGYHFEGVRHDIGNRLDYVRTFIEFALAREDIGPAVREFLKTLVKG
ncbi:MAG: UTP--glucose-1-phosphate uridylyltransferase, partial [Verrucomicrobia bacterium]|nr:UTP--glucose-1-phosphate uridylyltransferase [Verrucomicrobiota bacterium]